MDRQTLAYFAGLLDGEGCISLNKTGALTVTIVGCWLPTLKFGHRLFGGVLYNKRMSNSSVKSCYGWRLYGEIAGEFMTKVLPYMREKEIQARVALSWLRKRKSLGPKSRLSYYQRLRDLKKVSFNEVFKLRGKLIGSDSPKAKLTESKVRRMR